MTYSFDTHFQSAVKSDSLVSIPLETLLDASAQASTAQYPLNPKKLDAIVKSFAKGKHLLKAPVLCEFNGTLYTVGGRHRTAAIDVLTRTYGINAKGKPELYSEVNRDTLSPIARLVRVDMVSVDSLETLSELILADNGSRVMTGPEQASVKAMGGYATEGDKFALRFSPILAQYLEDLTDSVGAAITVTAVTLKQICGKLRASTYTIGEEKVKVGISNLYSATDEQLHTIASHLAEFLSEQSLPTKFAQYYAPHITEFLTQAVELEDEDGEPVVHYDSNGDEIEVSYAEHMNSLIKVEPKVAKAPARGSVNKAKFEAMQAKLLAMGLDPDALV